MQNRRINKNGGLTDRQIRAMTVAKELDERAVSSIVGSMILVIASKGLIELDLDNEGIPSVVYQLGLVMLACSVTLSSLVLINKKMVSLKSNNENHKRQLAVTEKNEPAQHKLIEIRKEARIKQAAHKKKSKVSAWPTKVEIMSWFSLSKLKERWLSRSGKSRQVLHQSRLADETNDVGDIVDDESKVNKSVKKRKEKQGKDFSNKSTQKNTKEAKKTSVAPLISSTSDMFVHLEAELPQPQISVLNLMETPIAQSPVCESSSNSPDPSRVDDLASQALEKEKANAELRRQLEEIKAQAAMLSAQVLDENTHLTMELKMMKEQVATMSKQLTESTAESKNTSSLMKTQTAILSKQLLESDAEKSRLSEQLKEVLSLFSFLYPESKDSNSNADNLNLTNIKEASQLLNQIQDTMSGVRVTSLNPDSYRVGAFNQRSELEILLGKLMDVLHKADPTSSVAPVAPSMRLGQRR